MKPARIGLLALCLMVRPEPGGQPTAPIPTSHRDTVSAPLRQVAHDFVAPPMKERPAELPRRSELLPPPKPDAHSQAMTPTPPTEWRPDEIMVGPDGVMYRRLPAGNSADRR